MTPSSWNAQYSPSTKSKASTTHFYAKLKDSIYHTYDVTELQHPPPAAQNGFDFELTFMYFPKLNSTKIWKMRLCTNCTIKDVRQLKIQLSGETPELSLIKCRNNHCFPGLTCDDPATAHLLLEAQ